jgi:hypothetical protein
MCAYKRVRERTGKVDYRRTGWGAREPGTEEKDKDGGWKGVSRRKPPCKQSTKIRMKKDDPKGTMWKRERVEQNGDRHTPN